MNTVGDGSNGYPIKPLVRYREREWKDLTKQEFIDVTDGLEDLEDCWIAIQAKLREKNV
jgi:hypothetical protein